MHTTPTEAIAIILSTPELDDERDPAALAWWMELAQSTLPPASRCVTTCSTRGCAADQCRPTRRQQPVSPMSATPSISTVHPLDRVGHG